MFFKIYKSTGISIYIVGTIVMAAVTGVIILTLMTILITAVLIFKKYGNKEELYGNNDLNLILVAFMSQSTACSKNCLKIQQVKSVKVINIANGGKQDYKETKYNEYNNCNHNFIETAIISRSIELVLMQGNQNQGEIPREEHEQRNHLEQDGRNKDITKEISNVTSTKLVYLFTIN